MKILFAISIVLLILMGLFEILTGITYMKFNKKQMNQKQTKEEFEESMMTILVELDLESKIELKCSNHFHFIKHKIGYPDKEAYTTIDLISFHHEVGHYLFEQKLVKLKLADLSRHIFIISNVALIIALATIILLTFIHIATNFIVMLLIVSILTQPISLLLRFIHEVNANRLVQIQSQTNILQFQLWNQMFFWIALYFYPNVLLFLILVKR